MSSKPAGVICVTWSKELLFTSIGQDKVTGGIGDIVRGIGVQARLYGITDWVETQSRERIWGSEMVTMLLSELLCYENLHYFLLKLQQLLKIGTTVFSSNSPVLSKFVTPAPLASSKKIDR